MAIENDVSSIGEEKLNGAIIELHVAFAPSELQRKYQNLRDHLIETDNFHLLRSIFSRMCQEYFKNTKKYETKNQPTHI